MSNEELRDDVEVLVEELLVILMEVERDHPTLAGGEGELALREALGALTEFRNRGSMSERALGDITYAKELLESAAAAFEPVVLREGLTDAAGYLDTLRSRAIERAVESYRRGGGRKSIPAAAPDVQASIGFPAMLSGIELALPRVLPVEESLAQTRENAVRPTKPKAREPQDQSHGGTAGERRQVEVLGRDLMEDIAALSSLRLMGPHELWQTAKPFEERLLASLDALFCLARPVRRESARLDLAEALYKYATEWVVPDRGRTFAFAFTLSAVSHPSALLWVTMGFLSAEDRAFRAYVDAFAMSPNPRMGDHLVSLLSSDLSREQTTAVLEAARRRGTFSAGRMLALASHPDWEVASEAVRCLAHAPAGLASTVLPSVLEEGSANARAIAATIMLERGLPDAARSLRAVAEELIVDREGRGETSDRRAARAQCLLTLSVFGEPADADRVWTLARKLSSYREVGFFGAYAHVERLYAVMKELDEATVDGPIPGALAQLDDAASAISRITGVDVPSYGSGRYDLVALKDRIAGRAAALGAEHGRLRWGKAWTRDDCVQGLGDPAARQADRRIYACELALVSQGVARLDPDTWTTSQEHLIGATADAWQAPAAFKKKWEERTHFARSR